MIQLTITESEYTSSLFPVIPTRVQGYDTLLVSLDGIPRLVDDYLTTRDIRKGNFNKLVRIPTTPFSLDVFIKATSKNAPYKFDICVGVDCRICNSVAFYIAKSNYDIEKSLNTALTRIVAPEAKKYELTDEGSSDGILFRLQEKEQYLLEALGIAYTVEAVDAKPDANAENNFIKKLTDQKLNIQIEQSKIKEINKLSSRNMEDAILGQVAEGKIDLKTALEQVIQSNRTDNYNKLDDIQKLIEFVQKLRNDSLITDDEAGQHINEILRALPSTNSDGISKPTIDHISQIEEKNDEDDYTLDDLFSDEENM